jgi:streptogramin lyase
MPGVHHVLAAPDGRAWTCQRGPLVARLDSRARQAVAVSAPLKKGAHLAFDAHENLLLVADSAADEVLALDADDLHIVERWSAPGGPQLPIVSPEGVCCVTGGSTGSLTFARPRRGEYRVKTIAVGANPHDPLIAADGEHVLVPCMGSSEIVKVRLSDGGIVGRVGVGQGPAHMKGHPDGRVYVANSWDGTLTCLSRDGVKLAEAPSGGWAHAVDITPDERFVWVANFLDDTVAVFDADTLARVALLETEPYPHGLDIAPDGKRAVVTGFASRHVRVFDTATWQLLARIEVGLGPSHTAFIAGTDGALVGCSVADHIACIDLANGVAQEPIRLHEH